jgi:hypothetical protein
VSTLLASIFCAAQDSSQPQMPEGSQPTLQTVASSGQEQAPATANTGDSQAATPAGQTQSQSQDQSQSRTQSQTPDDKKGDKSGAASDKAQSGASTGTPSGTSSTTPAATSKDRLFFALPNFLTVENSGKVVPLTAEQKFKVVARGAFDPFQIVWYAALSGIGQAENSEPGFGQGWESYGKRYGAYAADGTIENFFVGAIMPSLLHQDPRFFLKSDGSFFSRAKYAVTRIVITRSDSGRREFNFSEVFGAAFASAISTYSYHPHPGYTPGQAGPYIASDRTLRNTATVWGSQMGYDAVTIAIKEFWPAIRGKIKKQQQ